MNQDLEIGDPNRRQVIKMFGGREWKGPICWTFNVYQQSNGLWVTNASSKNGGCLAGSLSPSRQEAIVKGGDWLLSRGEFDDVITAVIEGLINIFTGK